MAGRYLMLFTSYSQLVEGVAEEGEEDEAENDHHAGGLDEGFHQANAVYPASSRALMWLRPPR